MTCSECTEKIVALEEELVQWKKLFFMLKEEHIKNVCDHTCEWMVYARELGVDV